MKQILLIGIGQTGSTVSELFSNKLNNSGVPGRALAIDTDEESLSAVTLPQKVFLTDEYCLSSVVEALGEDTVKEYFPSDWENDDSIFAKGLEMKRGANLWRAKAFLAFNSFLTKDKRVAELHDTLDSIVADCGEDGEIELCVAASLAGGTGSGLFVPITLYVKKYIESIGGKVSFSRAFLAMPSIYKYTLLSERGTKGYANAYTALRELNAINTVAFNGYNSEKILKHPYIDFKIELSHGNIKKLFNSKEEEFYTSSAAPFDKVTLFEKIPTVDTVSEHVGVIADAIFLSCQDEQEGHLKKTNPEAVIGSLSLTRVNYPMDSIVDYITKKQIHTFVATEVGNIAQIAEKYLQNKIFNAKNERRVLSSSLDLYRDSYISAVEDILEKSNKLPEKLIGREIDPGVELEVPSDLYDISWLGELDIAIENSITNDGFKAVAKVISENKVIDPKKNTFAKKNKKQIGKIVESIKPSLSKAFLEAQAVLKEYRNQFITNIISTNETDFSFVNDVICDNGNYLHPIYALFRLCLAHKKLEKYKSSWSDVPVEPRNNYPFPAEIMIVGNYRKKETDPLPATKYFRYGINRFEALLAFDYGQETGGDDKAKTKKKNAVVTDDSETFFKDLETVYNRLLSGVKRYRYLTAIEVLETLIERYRAFINGCVKISSDVAADGELALVSGSSSNAITVNVGASIKEKKILSDKYLSEYNSRIEDILANDVAISENVVTLILSDLSQNEIGNLQIKDLLCKTELIYKEYLKKSEFYEKFLNKDIMTAMRESVEGDFSSGELSYNQIFGARYNPLNTKIGTSTENPDRVATSRIALSDKVASAILAEPEKYEGKLPADYVNGVVAEFVEYGTSIRFSQNVQNQELFVCKETEGIELSAVIFADELSEDKEGYTAFKESINNKRTRGTSMWNTALIYRNESGHIPFISQEKQYEYEKAVAKAVIYAFVNDMLSVENNEEHGKMYFMRRNFDKIPIFVGNLPVRKNDIKNIARWAYERPEWTEKTAEKYDRIYSKSKIDSLCKTMLDMISTLDSQQALDSEGYADRIACVVNEKLLKYYFKNIEDISEKAAVEYSNDLRSFFDQTIEVLGDSQAKKFAEWFNSKGFFLDCTICGDFCEFKF